MRYLDTGARQPNDTLAHWFSDALAEGIAELRFQTGYYSFDGLAPIEQSLDGLRANNGTIKALIGANAGATLASDVKELADRMGVPRQSAFLGVVGYEGSGLFHPKVYHIVRPDGSQAAYVGSSNLTRAGLTLHIEAGVSLDSRMDGETELDRIALAIDEWFGSNRPGFTLVSTIADVDQLEASGKLASAPKPRLKSGVSAAAALAVKLGRLLTLPAIIRRVTKKPVTPSPIVLPSPPQPPTQLGPVGPPVPPSLPTPLPVPQQVVPQATPTPRPVTNIGGYPGYFLIAPNKLDATVGWHALTGTPLPGGTTGLIVVLNRDSARHFAGRPGTANISLPVATMSTIRFGREGVHNEPAARFDLGLRFIDGGALDIRVLPAATSVKGYGYAASATGHGDIRMLVPAAVRGLGVLIQAAGKTVPAEDDFALLEWPTDVNPQFRLSFLETNSPIFTSARAAFQAAVQNDQIIGNSAAWLPAGMAPAW